MKEISQFISYILPLLYLAVIYVYYLLFTGKKKTWINKTTLILGILLIIHGFEIGLRHAVLNTIPFSTVHDALSFLGFSILFVYMIIELRLKNRGSGIFVLFFAFILEVVSTFNLSWEPETNELLSSPTFAIHAAFTIMGYTAMSLSALYAIMYIIQNHNLKKRNLGKLFTQLPALNYLEKMSIQSAFMGIVLLGIGLLMGHVQAEAIMGEFWPNDVKVIAADIAWALYLTGYIVAQFLRLHGKKMAYLSIAGYFVLVVGGFLIANLADTFHEFN
jgi:HemX protein